MESQQGYDEGTWRSLGELGLPGLLISAQYGGQSLGTVEMALVFEAFGAKLLPSPLLATGVLSACALSRLQHPRAQALSSSIACGECRATIASIEKRKGRYVLDAHAADFLLIEHAGILSLHEARASGQFEGIEVTRLNMMDRTRVLSHLQIDRGFDSAANAIAEGEETRAACEYAFDMGRLAIAAEAVGAAQECLTRTLDYVKERVQFGRKIGSFQAVKHQLADVMVSVEAARSAVYYAAASVDDAPSSLPHMAALAKVEASEALQHAAGRMIQLHGGIGFTWEHDAHLYFKRARATATLFGSDASLDERIACHIGLGEVA